VLAQVAFVLEWNSEEKALQPAGLALVAHKGLTFHAAPLDLSTPPELEIVGGQL